ncbi:MAG: molybdopterin molybdotransferase MoeA [Cyclobacteriaceae bacterium]|nr:molybdopterin molybdotransferase MoeA [Cyclobacteriaceae bacterium]
MITSEEALDFVENNIRDFGIEEIPLAQGINRVLREDIHADRDFPPFDRVTMDGIAISYDRFKEGRNSFKIEATVAAGSPKMTLIDADNCLEVMTGAIMPEGVDTVIRYEDITINEGVAVINIEELKHRQNIHFKGIDRKKDDIILRSGIRISPSEIGVCATVGKTKIKVSRLPKTIIISTGDELVEIDKAPLAHQIRKSNVYLLQTALKHYNLPVDTAHLQDDYDSIVEKLKNYLKNYELIILSGGVSKGKYDYLPEALKEVGVEKLFHKVKQRPGKPFWFGKYKEEVTVFAFPGNPVPSFLCTQHYFKRWLNKSIQYKPSLSPKAKLGADVNFMPDLTYFLEVKLSINDKAEVIAQPIKGNGSGDLANLVDADAFIILPRGRNDFYKDEIFPIIMYREISI